jgi:hypothetical protein
MQCSGLHSNDAFSLHSHVDTVGEKQPISFIAAEHLRSKRAIGGMRLVPVTLAAPLPRSTYILVHCLPLAQTTNRWAAVVAFD